MPRPPRLSGLALRSAARLARSRIGGLTLPAALRAEFRFDELARLPDELRGDLRLDNAPVQARPPRQAEDARLPAPQGPWSPTSAAIAQAYRTRRTTPPEVVDRVLEQARSLAGRDPSMAPLYLAAEDAARAEAVEAMARIHAGHARGPFDGVPCAIKEEMAVRGFPWAFGSTVCDTSPQPRDATCVARLRATGAIVVGITAMTEFGMTPVGINPKRPMPRNPHAPDTVAGGSSTGSAVAVATGLVPFALGADGGGSIRIPSSLCGIFGFKPTWGRISREHASGGSVAHVGPLASSTLDLARVLDAVSGPDDGDAETRRAPPLAFEQFERAVGRGVRGMVIGVEDGEWADAPSPIAAAGREALRALEKEGAKLVPVKIPLARYAPRIGYALIAAECRAIVAREWRERGDEMTPDVRVLFSAVDTITAPELLDAQRLRAGLRRDVAATFCNVDLLALPSTACTAPRVTNAEMRSGMLDTRLIDALCRFAFLGNLTGLPASSAPVGRDGADRPIGLQLVGDAWDEATVLAATAHLERLGVARAPRPAIAVDVLGGS